MNFDRKMKKPIKPQREETPPSWHNLSETLVPEAVKILESMYRSEPQLGSDGRLHEIDSITRISREQGCYLYNLHKTHRPELSVEIGLAYGFSTIFLLSAMKEGEYGHHIAIDPFQNHPIWKGIGLQKVQELEMASRFTFMEEKSITAIPRLIDEGRKAQFIFVDGDHKFDSVIVDFVLADHICALNGHIIFDDMWMPSIRKVVQFIKENRGDYLSVACPIENIAVFQKVGSDTRDWRHYVEF
jgi:predicted O-methyltransferase YrrM